MIVAPKSWATQCENLINDPNPLLDHSIHYSLGPGLSLSVLKIILSKRELSVSLEKSRQLIT
jgi:hypothetical protein